MFYGRIYMLCGFVITDVHFEDTNAYMSAHLKKRDIYKPLQAHIYAVLVKQIVRNFNHDAYPCRPAVLNLLTSEWRVPPIYTPFENVHVPLDLVNSVFA